MRYFITDKKIYVFSQDIPDVQSFYIVDVDPFLKWVSDEGGAYTETWDENGYHQYEFEVTLDEFFKSDITDYLTKYLNL